MFPGLVLRAKEEGRYYAGNRPATVKTTRIKCPVCGEQVPFTYYRCSKCKTEGWYYIAHRRPGAGVNESSCTGRPPIPEGEEEYAGNVNYEDRHM